MGTEAWKWGWLSSWSSGLGPAHCHESTLLFYLILSVSWLLMPLSSSLLLNGNGRSRGPSNNSTLSIFFISDMWATTPSQVMPSSAVFQKSNMTINGYYVLFRFMWSCYNFSGHISKISSSSSQNWELVQSCQTYCLEPIRISWMGFNVIKSSFCVISISNVHIYGSTVTECCRTE